MFLAVVNPHNKGKTRNQHTLQVLMYRYVYSIEIFAWTAFVFTVLNREIHFHTQVSDAVMSTV